MEWREPLPRSEISNEALELIRLADKLVPEGEGLDLSDKEYTVQDLIEIKQELSRMRKSIDETNRALAAAWLNQYGDTGAEWLDTYYYLGAQRKVRFQPEQDIPFFEWLRTQDADVIAGIVPARTLRVTGMPSGIKDAFLDTSVPELDAKTARIQAQPARKGRKK